MKIFLGILAFIIFIIITVLFIPVHIIIKKETKSELFFDIKIFSFSLIGNGKSAEDSLETIKKLFKQKKNPKEKEEKKKTDKQKKLSKYINIFTETVSEICKLFKKIKVNRLYLTVICAEENAADTAISYGRCCALIYPAIGILNSSAKIDNNNQKIDIFCDYTTEKSLFSIDTDFSIRIFRILSALIKVGLKFIK